MADGQVPRAPGVEACGIGRVAVIGAGAMGAGIAAQFANAGVPVDLLDVAGAADDQNEAAKSGILRQLKSGGFLHESAAGLVAPGNVDDHMHRLADADWIIEAIVERLDAKRDLYRRIDAVRKSGAIVSSNTSTLLRADLVAGLPADFASGFFITHFFNPPRLMQLVELVSSPQDDNGLATKVAAACEVILGKTVIACRDTPGLIANRLGCYWVASGILQAKRLGLHPELADASLSALGVPRTGVFGLVDLAGIDLIPAVWGSLMASLPATDMLNGYDLPGDPTIRILIDSGRFGRKTKAGFYRQTDQMTREVVDFATGEYRPATILDPMSLPGGGVDLPAFLAAEGSMSSYARRVLCEVVAYAAHTAPDMVADVAAIDVALELGYGWQRGPFKLADQVGLQRLAGWLDDLGILIPPLLQAAVEAGGFYAASGKPLATSGARL